MKSVRDYIAGDMWGHILMSGPDIRGYLTGTMYKTADEQRKYCEGIFTMYPHMMLGNLTHWLWEKGAPKDYQAFMDSSVKALQAEVFPVLERAFGPGISSAEKGQLLIPLLTDLIPKYVLTGFYDYMFAGQEDYRDISEFFTTVEPLLSLTAKELQLCYSGTLSKDEAAELFLFVGTRYPYLLLKRWYDWKFGVEKMDMPPPPQ